MTLTSKVPRTGIMIRPGQPAGGGASNARCPFFLLPSSPGKSSASRLKPEGIADMAFVKVRNPS